MGSKTRAGTGAGAAAPAFLRPGLALLAAFTAFVALALFARLVSFDGRSLPEALPLLLVMSSVYLPPANRRKSKSYLA